MKKQTIRMYIPPTLQSQKVTANLKLILLVKIFNLKQKQKKNKWNTSSGYGKNQIISLQENRLVFF